MLRVESYGARPRSQAALGNAHAGEALFRMEGASAGRSGERHPQTPPPGQQSYPPKCFPNGVWERGEDLNAGLANAERYGKRVDMKSITIAELHEHTEEVVLRMSGEDGFVITTKGQPVAILRPAQERRSQGKPLPKRSPATLPTTKADSTDFISEERGAR